MSDAHWPRPQWQDSSDQAFLLWFVFGELDTNLQIDAVKYRTRGTPAGFEVVRYANKTLANWEGYPLAGTLGRVLWDENASLFERAKSARDCVMLRGAIADPSDLDVLRDLVGSIAALCDSGAVAVVDPQTLSMLAAPQWRERFFDGDAVDPRDHVLILCDADEEAAGRMHVHTRGMRKFARPDIGIRNVPSAVANVAGELAERFVHFQALGGIVADGRVLEIDGAPSGMTVRHAGAIDDPAFNNRHLALRWPD
jgi:hypothetical protein